MPQGKERTDPDASRSGDAGQGEDDESDTDAWDESAHVVEVPIDGTLDLHTFRPKEVGDLVPEYLTACHERGIFQVRVVHGKGRGMLRRSVHALLERNPLVESFHLAEPFAGGWGATLVTLVRSPDGENP